MFIPEGDGIISQTYMTLFRGGKYQHEAFRKQDYIVRLFVILSARKCSSLLLRY